MTSAEKNTSREGTVCTRYKAAWTSTIDFAAVVAVVMACTSGTNAIAASLPTENGTLLGQYACDENLSPTSRSKASFSVPVELAVNDGMVNGKRENAQTIDVFSGSMDPFGHLNVELAGHWKDDPSRRWLGRFRGPVRDGLSRIPGEMLATDGRTKLRDCALTLTLVPLASPQKPSTPTGSKAPVPGPTSEIAQVPVPQSSKVAPRSESKPSSSQFLPPRVVELLKVFRQSLEAVGLDPEESNERLAEAVSDAYRRGNFGNAFENNCRPLDGPYKLEQLGRLLAMRPFHWTPEMAVGVELLWREFINACPGYGQLGDAFLSAIRGATEERARQVAALKASHAAKKAESEVAQAREAERKRAARQQQEDAQRRALADRERQAGASVPAEVRGPTSVAALIVGTWECVSQAGPSRTYHFAENGVFSLLGRDSSMLIEIAGPFKVTNRTLRMVEGLTRVTEGKSLRKDWGLIAPADVGEDSSRRNNYRDRTMTISSLDGSLLTLRSESVSYRPGGPPDQRNPFVLTCRRSTDPVARATWQTAPLALIGRVQMP